MLGDDLLQACRLSIVVTFASKATSLFIEMSAIMNMLSRGTSKGVAACYEAC